MDDELYTDDSAEVYTVASTIMVGLATVSGAAFVAVILVLVLWL